MNRIYIHNIWVLFMLIPCLACCSYIKGADAADAEKNSFSLPEIPSSLIFPQDRASYLVSHYWQNFDFRDTVLISKPEITEQAFVDFIDILPNVPYDNAERAITKLMDSASVDVRMFSHFTDLAEKYLYDPNSAFRNDEYYIPVLQYILADGKLDESAKVRPRYQLGMAMRNRPGAEAADFIYTLPGGKTGRMKDIKADYTVLFFNNPDCPECKMVKEFMTGSPVFLRMAEGNRQKHPSLAVLAVYTDSDISSWRSASYPEFMINAYDASGTINKEQLYDLKATPTLYLLDKDKYVILKDATVEQVEATLKEHLSQV